MVCQGHEASFLVARDTLGVHLESWQGNQDASRVEAGNPESCFFCHRDLGLCINFQGESIVVSC